MFDEVEEPVVLAQMIDEMVDEVADGAGVRRQPKQAPPPRNLLRQETVAMTVFAQDPIVIDPNGPVLAAISVPADRLQRGPRNHRFHVVDVQVGTGETYLPVVLHDEGNPWNYTDRWSDSTHLEPGKLAENRDFRAQNVFAVAAHTLALFEQHLGRPIPWNSGYPQLFLIPAARVEANAFYSRQHNGVLFGWLPAIGEQPAMHTALSFDVVAHEVSHAVLDGLRPRYIEPSLPDQLAFHEALADLVAMFSVFDLKEVPEHLLDLDGDGTFTFPSDTAARKIADPEAAKAKRIAGRAERLKDLPLTSLAEQLGGRRSGGKAVAGHYPALRRSVALPANDSWKDDEQYAEPHRRAEVLVAAFMQTFVAIWAGRIDELATHRNAMDVSRLAEEGTKAARHLLAMLLRALDYLPPVDLEFADVLDSVLTADTRLVPDDEHGYRKTLEESFGKFGITAPAHHIVDQDGVADYFRGEGPSSALAGYPADPDTKAKVGVRYEHLNLVALRTSPEEVYQFIWSNAAVLKIDVRLTTRVERVLASTRVGPDGLIVNEILADYTQTLRTTARDLPPGIEAPAGVDPDTVIELWGGGVLVFDQFGRFRLHQRQPILDIDRQTRRLRYLAKHDRDGFLGSGAASNEQRFAMLHRGLNGAL